LVERIRSQVVHEGRGGRNFRFIDAELLDNNLLNAFFHTGHSCFLRDLLSLGLPFTDEAQGRSGKLVSAQPGVGASFTAEYRWRR
jgi:hypothetical protein